MNEEIKKAIQNDFALADIPVPLFVLAPMVRYSKLAFRQLVSKYGADVVYTPMIYADSFCVSKKCAMAEFRTVENEMPIVQFASHNAEDFATAAELVYSHASGIDLNCGCPKKAVTSKCCGAALLKNPELIADIVKQTRGRISDPNFVISCKIRIENDKERTMDLVRQLEAAGVSRIAIHGRTKLQGSHEEPDYDFIRTIKESLNVPVFANGGVHSYSDLIKVAKLTGADGIMVANGILTNPALFSRYEYVPQECVAQFIELEGKHGLIFELFHQHLIFMLRHLMAKPDRLYFNELRDVGSVKKFMSLYTAS
uniref:tRNA-dihydrouridine synthase n=1 Tax=Rhabditophanes sp. KR3021 TaxID=114890 RepID=A0AC35UEA9_9BILA